MSVDILYKQIAVFYRSLADENRLRILVNLAEGQKSVSEIVEQAGLSQPLVSHHLKELKSSLLVKTERRSSFVFYELTEPTILELLRLTNQLVVELSEKNNSLFSHENKLSVPFPIMMKKMSKIMNQSLSERSLRERRNKNDE